MNSLKEYLKRFFLSRIENIGKLTVIEYFRMLALICFLTGAILLFSDFDTQINHGSIDYSGTEQELTYLADWLFYVSNGAVFLFTSRFIEYTDKIKR